MPALTWDPYYLQLLICYFAGALGIGLIRRKYISGYRTYPSEKNIYLKEVGYRGKNILNIYCDVNRSISLITSAPSSALHGFGPSPKKYSTTFSIMGC